MTEDRKPEKTKDFLEKFLQISGKVFEVLGKIIKWWFWISMFLVGVIFWLLDLWLGDGRNPVPAPWDNKQPEFDPNQFRQDLEKSTPESILKQFGKQLEELENRNKLEPDEKKVVRKLKGLDRQKLRSQLQDALSDDERETLFIILLKLLGFIKAR